MAATIHRWNASQSGLPVITARSFEYWSSTVYFVNSILTRDYCATWEADTGDTGARTNMTNPTKCVSFAPIVADNERAGVLVRKSALKKTSSHPPVSARRNHAGLIDLRCAWGVVINAGFLDLVGCKKHTAAALFKVCGFGLENIVQDQSHKPAKPITQAHAYNPNSITQHPTASSQPPPGARPNRRALAHHYVPPPTSTVGASSAALHRLGVCRCLEPLCL